MEMILRLHETKGYARAIDISCGLSVTKPSVSVAMRNLRENGYIINTRMELESTGIIHSRELRKHIYRVEKMIKRMKHCG